MKKTEAPSMFNTKGSELTGGIGESITRPNARRLLKGRGAYVDDYSVKRMAYVAFVRSPFARARIMDIDAAEAMSMEGVLRVVTGEDLKAICTPWQGVLSHLDMKSPEQWPLAISEVKWQGEPIVAVVATSRAIAEDAAAVIYVEMEELHAVVGIEAAQDVSNRVHDGLADNTCFSTKIESTGFEDLFSKSEFFIQRKISFGRHTGVPLEPRSIVADFNPADRTLVVHQSHQAPHMMRDLFAKHFGLSANQVRVICDDVGGGFGVKVHCYPDEMATVACALLCERPVKFIADRFESFASDVHGREHEVDVKMGFLNDGTLVGIELHDITAIGAYSAYPRTSLPEGLGVINYSGGAYDYKAHRGILDVYFQNKVPTSQFRAVGHPIACATVESMFDHAARELKRDPTDLRLQNLRKNAAAAHITPSGLKLANLSHQECFTKLLSVMDYRALREEQAQARQQGRYLGIGVAVLIELTAPGIGTYSKGGTPIASQDGATLRLETDGSFTCLISVGDQGQGTETAMMQIAATALGVSSAQIHIVSGDTSATPVGGGAYGSRTTAISGEAVLQAGQDLKNSIFKLVEAVTGEELSRMTTSVAGVTSAETGNLLLSWAEIADIGYFRQDKLPPDFQAELISTRHFINRLNMASFTNGAQASLVEVDPEMGSIRLLKHWVVEDCGTIINPKLVDEQMRGGIVQGLGMALFEHCQYTASGQLQTSTFADYLVPLAGDMPDIIVEHVVTPTTDTQLGAKGAGEAGTAGAPAAVLNAVNDAISPFNAEVNAFPITPERILHALGKVNLPG